MGVTVFDSDVLIGFLNRDDAHHQAAIKQVRDAMLPGRQRILCAVTYAEILVAPVRAGVDDRVKKMLRQFSMETVVVDDALAERAAAVRGATKLKIPDAFVLATALLAQQRDADVSVATFDQRLLKACERLARD